MVQNTSEITEENPVEVLKRLGKIVPSHLDAINSLIGGHLVKIPTLIFGSPAAGKSLFEQQLAMDFLARGQNVLWVDCEGGADVMFELWRPKYMSRFSLDYDIKVIYPDTKLEKTEKPTVFIIEARHIINILGFHGVNIDLEVTKGKSEDSVAKINLRYLGKGKNLVKELIQKGEVKMLVYDSLTAPMKTTFVGGRIQFPARADAFNLWLGAIKELVDTNSLVIYGTSHSSVDPTNPYANPHTSGGDTIKYVFKCSLYMQASKSPKYKNNRKLYIERFFNIPPWQKWSALELTEKNGYEDRAVADE